MSTFSAFSGGLRATLTLSSGIQKEGAFVWCYIFAKLCQLRFEENCRGQCISFFPEVVSTIKHNFYVDNCLKSMASEEEAIQVIKDLIALCDRGGFSLQNGSLIAAQCYCQFQATSEQHK